MAKRDYYEILGVPRNASDKDIKAAYRKHASKYYPDKHEGPAKIKAEALFKEGKEAYEMLGDASKRAAYDEYGHDGLGKGYDRAPRETASARPAKKKVVLDPIDEEIFTHIFPDFGAQAAEKKRKIDDIKARVKAERATLSPIYEKLKEAHLVYAAFDEALQTIAKDVNSPYRNTSTIADAAAKRIEALRFFSAGYQLYKDEQGVAVVTGDTQYRDLYAHNVALQRIEAEHGLVLRAFHKNILELAHGSTNHPERKILERLSERNTDISDLVARLEAQKPLKTIWLATTQKALTAEIDGKIKMLNDMVDQYRQLAPVLAELGYTGGLYNKNGRSGDIQFAVSNILREIKEVPEELRRLNPKAATPPLFDPHKIFKDLSLFAAEHNELEVNAFLTPAQRQLVAWAQPQIHRSSVFDKIDEATVSAALSSDSINGVERTLSQWKKYVERALLATKTRNPHLSTGEDLAELIAEMNDLFSISDQCLDVNSDYFERNMGRFNGIAIFEQYIKRAKDAKPMADSILRKPLLTCEDAVSFLTDINPSVTLTGVLKVSQPPPDPTFLYKEVAPS